MIHRMCSWCLEIAQSTGSTCTDWIQAIAASVAVVGTLFTLWKLYRRDEQKQEMIGELGKLAKESMKQTQHLADQVKELALIHTVIAQGNKNKAKHEEQVLEQERAKTLPRFQVTGYAARSTGNPSMMTLTNHGNGKAYDPVLREMDGSAVRGRFLNNVIEPGATVRVGLSPGYDPDDRRSLILSFGDQYTDRYTQLIQLIPGTLPKAGPVEQEQKQ